MDADSIFASLLDLAGDAEAIELGRRLRALNALPDSGRKCRARQEIIQVLDDLVPNTQSEAA